MSSYLNFLSFKKAAKLLYAEFLKIEIILLFLVVEPSLNIFNGWLQIDLLVQIGFSRNWPGYSVTKIIINFYYYINS